jgi:tRNA-splicing ligase RtcB
MRVGARVFADDQLLTQMQRDRSLQQLANVTTLPGVWGAALGMPDMHEGYGFRWAAWRARCCRTA